MISVDTINGANINSPVGPSRNIKRLYQNNDSLNSEGVFLQGLFTDDRQFTDLQSYVLSPKHKINARGKHLLNQTSLGSLIWFKKAVLAKSLYAAKCYQSSNEKADVAVFRDLFSCHYCIKSKFGLENASVLFMHNDGSIGDLLFAAHPKLKFQLFEKWLERSFCSVIEAVDIVAFISKKAKQNFERSYPQYEDKTMYVCQGVEKPIKHGEIMPFSKSENDVVFVTAGSVCKRKNQISILKAMNIAASSNIKLLMVGDGEDLEYCRKYIAKNQLSGRAYAVGGTDSVGDYLDFADAFILPSLNEGLPVAAVEAMSYSLPLFLSDVGGCSELIRDNGAVIKHDVASIAEILKWGLENQQELRRQGKLSQTIYQAEYSIEKMLKGHAEIYREAYERNTKRKQDGDADKTDPK